MDVLEPRFKKGDKVFWNSLVMTVTRNSYRYCGEIGCNKPTYELEYDGSVAEYCESILKPLDS